MKRQSKIILRALMAVVVFALSLVPVRYSNSVFAYLMPIALLVLFIISCVTALILRKKLSFDYGENEVLECMRGEKVTVSIKVRNESFLICPCIKAVIYLKGRDGCGSSETPVSFSLKGKSTSDFTFDVTMKHIGLYSAGIGEIYIRDLLGILSFRADAKKEITITVLPRAREGGDLPLLDKMLTEKQDARKTQLSDGFDYTSVREYVPGDAMKRIHWKLSAHSTGYMTKQTESSRTNDLTIIADLCLPECDENTLLSLNDCVIETAVGIGGQALRGDTEFRLLYSSVGNQVEQFVPNSASDYSLLVRKLPTPSFKEKRPDSAEMLEAEAGFSNRSANLAVCTAKLTPQLIEKLEQTHRQLRSPILYLCIPHETGSDKKAEISRSLRMLDDLAIPYYFVETASEGMVEA